MTFHDHKSTELLRNDELNRASKVAHFPGSYLNHLSSTIMNILRSEPDMEDPTLQKHLSAQLKERFRSKNHEIVMSRLRMVLLDVQTELGSSRTTAQTWCLSSGGAHKSLSRESVAVLEWELRQHRVWMCVDIKVLEGGVGV